MLNHLSKQAVVLHSGGMDSSLCLALAIREFGADQVLSLSFSFNQRHHVELDHAKKISAHWNVDHAIVQLNCLSEITTSALIGNTIPIEHQHGKPPNTLVIGRNGLMAMLGGIHAHHLKARCIYIGIIGVEGSNSGYRDCSRSYMDGVQHTLRIDLDDPSFEIRTPIVDLTKEESLELAYRLGMLDYLLNETLTCYEGIAKQGCLTCPACLLRNEGIKSFFKKRPHLNMPYAIA